MILIFEFAKATYEGSNINLEFAVYLLYDSATIMWSKSDSRWGL